jgi:hypothetical protein
MIKQKIRCKNCGSIWEIEPLNEKGEVVGELLQCPLCYNEALYGKKAEEEEHEAD